MSGPHVSRPEAASLTDDRNGGRGQAARPHRLQARGWQWNCAHEMFLARGADRAGAPLADEAEQVRWMPLGELPGLIATGQITGAATIIIGAQHALLAAGQRTH